MSTEDGNFFSRWSRRKAAVRGGAAVPTEAPVAAVPAAVAVAAAPVAPPVEPVPAPPPTKPSEAPEPPPLTLDDVRRLTPDADFTPFVARDVAPEVRNAAFKKLFADPKFNVMDGLDIYIDDYSKPDPLPVSLARQLVSARSLGLFEEQAQRPAEAVPGNDLPPPPPPAAASTPSANPEPLPQPEPEPEPDPEADPTPTPPTQP